MKTQNSKIRKRVQFTDIGKLVDRLQQLTKKIDAHLDEIQELGNIVGSLWLQNKAALRNLLKTAKTDTPKIQEYKAREQMLKNAKDLVDHRIDKPKKSS